MVIVAKFAIINLSLQKCSEKGFIESHEMPQMTGAEVAKLLSAAAYKQYQKCKHPPPC